MTPRPKPWTRHRRSRAALLVAMALLLSGCGVSPNASHAFRIGWYTNERSGTEYLATYRREAVNLMVAYHSRGGYVGKWLRATDAQGIQVLLEPDPGWVRSGNMTALRAFVHRYDHSPNLYGWYLYDEPDFSQLPPARLVAAYDAIKSIDAHPVAVVFTTGHCRFGRSAIDPRYLAGFDLLMFDFYPFYRDLAVSHPASYAQHNDRQCVRTVKKYHKSGPIIVVQSFGFAQVDGPFLWRDPTYAETECQVSVAAAAGATGVLFWDDQVADSQVRRNSNRIIGLWHAGYSQAIASGGTPATVCVPHPTSTPTAAVTPSSSPNT